MEQSSSLRYHNQITDGNITVQLKYTAMRNTGNTERETHSGGTIYRTIEEKKRLWPSG